MPKVVPEIIGGLEIAAGAAVEYFSPGNPLGNLLITAGVGTVLSGIGTLLAKGPVNGFATTVRNPVQPWKVIYGRARTGGTVVHMHMWGDSAKMLDMVIVIAAHPCQSVDVLLFDQQRIQIDTTAAPAGAAAGSGTSFTPVQQQVNISTIQRSNGVATVTLGANIPYLIVGDQIQIAEDHSGPLTTYGFIGTVTVAQIITQTSGSLIFTYLSGGANATITSNGHVRTLWADYGRKVYMETLLGNQTLGQTFKGMASSGTPYDGDKGNYVSPENPGGLGGGSSSTPNPWTNYASLQGKTAVFLRLHYNDTYFKGGLPQISFVVHGKNDIYDPRTSTSGYTENSALCIADYLHNSTWGFGAAYNTEIPSANLIAAANVCDEQVPLAYSLASPPFTEPAYTCNGQFELTTRRGEVLQNMLTSCGGRLTDYGGQFVIWPASWRGNSFAIGSNPGGGVVSLPAFTQIAAGPIKWSSMVPIRELYNGVKGTYISQANKWQSADFPPYAQDTMHGYTYSGPSGDANLAADGGVRRWLDIQLPFTISSSTAQRLAKIELLRRRSFGTGTLTLNMTGYQIAAMDLMLVDMPFLSWSAKQLEVLKTRMRIEEQADAPALLVDLDVQETSSAVYSWSTTEELSPQGYVQPAIPGIGSFSFFATEATPGFAYPYPWLPGYVAPLLGDAVYTQKIGTTPSGPGNFGLQIKYGTDANGNPTANLLLKGGFPPNDLSGIHPPQIVCVAGTSGNLPAGTYVVAVCAYDTSTPYQNSPLSVPIPVTIGSAGGSIAVTVSWPYGSNGGDLFIARGMIQRGFHFQQHLSSSTTSVTITDFNESTSGAPDDTADHLAVTWHKAVHLGRFAAQVQAVTATTVTLGGAGVASNLWAGSVLTLLGKYEVAPASPPDGFQYTAELPILNMPVASNTASSGTPAEFICTIGPNAKGDQLPDLTTLLQVGDLLVMRFSPTFTATSFSDALIANPFYPSGATGVEAGHLAIVLSGPDAGDIQTIASVSVDGSGNSTIFNLAGSWAITPNSGDIVVIVEAAAAPEVPTQSYVVPNKTVGSVILNAQNENLSDQPWLLLVRAESASLLSGDDQFAPMRDFYQFGQSGQAINPGYYTITPVSGVATIDLANGRNQRIVLDGSSITIAAPIWTGWTISAGMDFTLYLDQDATGGRPGPTFTTGTGGFASDANDAGASPIAPDASTRTSILFEYHGSVWGVDSWRTKGATS